MKCDDVNALMQRERRNQENEIGFVYYLATSLRGPIKIGWTISLMDRMRAHRRTWPGCRLLAAEEGHRTLEGNRHAMFSACRVEGEREVFHREHHLMEHIEKVRSLDSGHLDQFWIEHEVVVGRCVSRACLADVLSCDVVLIDEAVRDGVLPLVARFDRVTIRDRKHLEDLIAFLESAGWRR